MKGIVDKQKYRTDIKKRIYGLEWGEDLWVDLNKINSLEDIIKMLNTAKDYLVETENGNTIYSLNGNSIKALEDIWKRIKGGETVEMNDSNTFLVSFRS